MAVAAGTGSRQWDTDTGQHTDNKLNHPDWVQGVAGNKKGEFEVEAQFLSKFVITYKQWLHFLKLLLKGTKKRGSVS
jgi:hypothetical protein